MQHAPASLHILPIIDGCIEFAAQVHEIIRTNPPDVLVVEYPEVLRQAFNNPTVGYTIRGWVVQPSPSLQWYFVDEPGDARVHAIRSFWRTDVPVYYIDVPEAGTQEDYIPLPDPIAAKKIGDSEYIERCLQALRQRPRTPRHEIIEQRLKHVITTNQDKRILAVLRMETAAHLRMETLYDADPEDIPPADPPLECKCIGVIPPQLLPLVCTEPPAMLFRWRQMCNEEILFDAEHELRVLLRQAAANYEEEFGERLTYTRWKAFAQYARNLSMLDGFLLPRSSHLLRAASDVLGGDFTLVLMETLNRASLFDELPKGESLSKRRSLSFTVEIDGVTYRPVPAYPRPPRKEILLKLRRRKHPKWLTEVFKKMWEEEGPPRGICSWPPEDVFIERFFQLIRERAFRQLGEMHSHSEEFQSSLLDGLDVRETIRNWHQKKLYVRRERKPAGKIGPVVVLWEHLPAGLEGVWQIALNAEHNNESDIVFYATPLGSKVIGPGISQIEYYGILSVFPAMHLPDLWHLDVIQQFDSLSDQLIAMGVVVSSERYLAVLSTTPPSRQLHQFANERGRALIYLPMDTFSSALVERARTCHILRGHHVRSYAADFIPEA